MINEKDFAKILKKTIDNMLKTKVCWTAINTDEEPNIEHLNYETLQNACKELGFYLYKLTESPIHSEETKQIEDSNKYYVIYSDETLKQVRCKDRK